MNIAISGACMVNLFNLTNKQKVRYTLITYVLTICSALCFIVLNNISSPYFNIGPSEKLIIFNIKIDTPSKYVYSQLFMIYINFIEIISVEGAAPILYFRIFNPDLKTINDFTKNELIFYNVTLNFMTALRSMILIIISLVQVDFVVLGTIYYQLMSIFITNQLLKLKKFDISNNVGAKEPLLSRELKESHSANLTHLTNSSSINMIINE